MSSTGAEYYCSSEEQVSFLCQTLQHYVNENFQPQSKSLENGSFRSIPWFQLVFFTKNYNSNLFYDTVYSPNAPKKITSFKQTIKHRSDYSYLLEEKKETIRKYIEPQNNSFFKLDEKSIVNR